MSGSPTRSLRPRAPDRPKSKGGPGPALLYGTLLRERDAPRMREFTTQAIASLPPNAKGVYWLEEDGGTIYIG